MSSVMNLAPRVDMMLLKSIFATNMSAVGIATSPGQLILSPPATNLVRLGSSILSRGVHCIGSFHM